MNNEYEITSEIWYALLLEHNDFIVIQIAHINLLQHIFLFWAQASYMGEDLCMQQVFFTVIRIVGRFECCMMQAMILNPIIDWSLFDKDGVDREQGGERVRVGEKKYILFELFDRMRFFGTFVVFVDKYRIFCLKNNNKQWSAYAIYSTWAIISFGNSWIWLGSSFRSKRKAWIQQVILCKVLKLWGGAANWIFE